MPLQAYTIAAPATNDEFPLVVFDGSNAATLEPGRHHVVTTAASTITLDGGINDQWLISDNTGATETHNVTIGLLTDTFRGVLGDQIVMDVKSAVRIIKTGEAPDTYEYYLESGAVARSVSDAERMYYGTL